MDQLPPLSAPVFQIPADLFQRQGKPVLFQSDQGPVPGSNTSSRKGSWPDPFTQRGAQGAVVLGQPAESCQTGAGYVQSFRRHSGASTVCAGDPWDGASRQGLVYGCPLRLLLPRRRPPRAANLSWTIPGQAAGGQRDCSEGVWPQCAPGPGLHASLHDFQCAGTDAGGVAAPVLRRV